MIKKIFFTLLIMLVSSNISFAKSADEVDSKNNNKIDEKNLNEAKSEPHFDLPKKDAKEQCEEVERVYNQCLDVIKKTDYKMVKCGNVYIDVFTTDGEDLHMLILDKYETKIGITLGKYPDYENGMYIGFSDSKKYIIKSKLVNFDFLQETKYKKFNIRNCYIENVDKNTNSFN